MNDIYRAIWFWKSEINCVINNNYNERLFQSDWAISLVRDIIYSFFEISEYWIVLAILWFSGSDFLKVFTQAYYQNFNNLFFHHSASYAIGTVLNIARDTKSLFWNLGLFMQCLKMFHFPALCGHNVTHSPIPFPAWETTEERWGCFVL